MKKSFLVLLLLSCVYLDNVNQPSSVTIGERFTIAINGNYNSGTTAGAPWLAMMLPIGFLIDSIRYETQGICDTFTNVVTQLDTFLSEYLDTLFPCDSNMHWQAFWGEYVYPYPETIGTYIATIYAMATDSVTPGTYLIDYLIGTDGYNYIEVRDSILDQPMVVASTGISEIADDPINNGVAVWPTIFRNTLNISTDTASLIEIYSNNGRLVKSFDRGSSIQNQGSAISWHGDDNAGRKLPSGVYFVKFKSGDYEATEKVLLVR